MKRMTCEMCGSVDVIKDGDFYVCQSCGTKYTPESAKQLLVEITGKVDVSGSTVTVDNSSFVRKSLENARRAKAKEDWEECEKYYNMVEQHDPSNIEAIFYSSYGKARMAMVESDRFKREQKMNVLKNSISVIDDNYDPSPEKYVEQRNLICQINDDLMKLVNGRFVFNTTTSNNITTNDSVYTYTMFIQLCLGWIESVQNIINVIKEPGKTLYLWWIMRQNYAYVYAHIAKPQVQNYLTRIHQLDAYIKSVDPNYQPPPLPPRSTSGGCYVATCVYGSYDCPQVWTLRRFRDDTLAETWYGRAFIRTYYAISPTLVRWFGDTEWFRKIWRKWLDKMVARLQRNGVSDKAYQDREW